MNKKWGFVIASHRSGTNMLLQSLNAIPGVHNLKEIVQVTFNDLRDKQETDDWRNPLLKKVFGIEDFPDYIDPQWLPWSELPDQHGVRRFIQYLIRYPGDRDPDSPIASHYHTFVCKLLFQHCPPYYYSLWKWLFSSEAKIIYLRRTNFLDICVSIENAIRTRQWYIPRACKIEPKNEEFELRLDDVFRSFSFLKMCDDFFTVLTRKHPNAIQIEYEDLIKNWTQQIRRIVTHLELDIDPAKVEQRSKRQITDHKQLIKNYDELKAFFRNTVYDEHFL